jgi:hypothetical protein
MKTIERLLGRMVRRHRQRGSALLVSLMVMVGLSLLGLAFVTVSETENAISLNQRNHAQTVAIAEAGAKLVVQWFQDPITNLNRGLMPANTNAIKRVRTVTTGGSYGGYYKPTGMLCDLPFGPDYPDLFMGTEDSADVIIDSTTNPTFLTNVNGALFPSLDNGQITEIRLYAPPIVGGTPAQDDGTGHFFYSRDGQRFGIASIRVTAQKMGRNGQAVAQAVVRMVVGPFPLPGPTGAIQAIGGITNNGNFDVHWGAVESQESVDLTKSGTDKDSIPWFNAWDILHLERGYDSSTTWVAGKDYVGNATYPLGDTVRPTSAASAAAQLHEYVAMTSGTSVGPEPAWDVTAGSITVGAGGIQWKERPRTMYPIKDSDATNYDNHGWLYEIIPRTVEDPWFALRSWKTTTGSKKSGGSATAPHPHPYAASPVPTSWGGSNWFQFQTFSSRPDYRFVEVPRFDYNYWKSAAFAGRGQKGVHYLYSSGSNYTDGVVTKSADNWLATGNGFYFFETTNSQNPQNGGTGTLHTHEADPCGFRGFAYLNYAGIKSTGCNPPDGWYPEPGEVFRDVGYRKVWNVASSGGKIKGQFDTDAAGVFVVDGAFNGHWDYEDLDWSNTGDDESTLGVKNNLFDVCVAQRTFTRESDTSPHTEWVPIEFYPGCHPGNNSDLPACNCSEPHEPYLNIKYSTATTGIAMGWNDPAVAGRPKLTDTELPSGTPVACDPTDIRTALGRSRCTTNAFDETGGLVSLDQVGCECVLYNEGDLDSTGNMDYFGSIVLGGVADPKGTPTVWYDDRLVHGGWPPKGVDFPRVMITSEQIQ